MKKRIKPANWLAGIGLGFFGLSIAYPSQWHLLAGAWFVAAGVLVLQGSLE